VPRRELVQQLRGLDYERHDRSIDSRIYRIRRKLGDDDEANQRVRTVRNRGYLLAASPW
jgi:two-component system response regulator RstA